MSGKRGPDEGQKYEWRPEGNLPIMGTMPDEFQPPRSCFDFPNPLAGKKETHEKYPPIVTIDGRVDTDIDHLIDEEEDYTGPVMDMPSKFPKPHVFTVVEGSLDDDIDNYLNDDGTIEHTLADPPKNFNPSELKDVASNDTTHKSLDLAKRCPTDMPLTNRSYNKTHTEHSENEVTNEIAEGELSINIGSHELCTDDQPSEELVEAGPRPDLVNAASYDKMDAITAQVVVSSEKKEAVSEGQSEKRIAPQENDSKQAEQLSPKASAMSEIFDKEAMEFRSPSDAFIVTDLERCSNVMYCQEDLSGRGDFILSTVVIENKDASLFGDTDQHTKTEDGLNTLKLNPLPEEVPAQQGRLSALLPPSDKSGTVLDAAHVLAISKESADANVVANSKNSPYAANISIPNCLTDQDNEKDGTVDRQVPQEASASSGQALEREADISDSDIDVTESLALLSKLEEYKGDKQKAREVLKEFKQMVLEGSQTKLDRLSKSESIQSSLDTPQRSLRNSEHMLNIPKNAVAKSDTTIGSTTFNGSLKDIRDIGNNEDAEKKNCSEFGCPNKSMPDQQNVVKRQSEPIVYKLSKNSEASHSTCPGLSPLPKVLNDGQPNRITESTEQNTSEQPEEGQIKHYCSPSADYLVSKYTHFQLAVAVDRELRSQSCDGKIHRMDESSIGVNDSSNSLCDRKTESLRAPRNPVELIESRKVVSKPGEPVPKQRGNRERSLSSSRKMNKHGVHAYDKKYDGAEIKEEFQTELGLSQKNAHKCPSSVKLDKDIPRRHHYSPNNTFSPGALSVDPLLRSENERSRERIRDRSVSVDRKMTWSFAEGKDDRYEESEVDPKYTRKESAQSIKESLKEAIKVAEESMSAAARVARALSIVIEATKPKFGNESSTDEEGLREGYDRLMTTMSTLAACKEYRRSHSTSPSKRLVKPMDNVVDLSNVKALPNSHTVSSSHGKLNEYSVDSEKHVRDHKKKEKPNDCDRKSSFVSDTSKGREARRPSPRQIPPKLDKKQAEEIAIVKSTCIEEKQRHEDKVRPIHSKGTNVDVKTIEENPEDKQRIQDSKNRAGEDKHGKVKSAEGKHRADSEGRRKHDKDKNRHEEKRHKSSRGKHERSADGRVKGLETKRSAEGLREPKKERAPDATPRQLKEAQEVQKTSSQESFIKDMESKGAVMQHTTYHAKSAHKTESKRDECETVPQKLPSQAHVSHTAHQSEETLSQKELHKATHLAEEVLAPPMHDKEEIGDSKMHRPADEARKPETGPHEWRIPLTKHNANRKAESIFEQVTLINPIGDGRTNKILVRRLLQGSRVDYAESEASETDSLEFDSNFNRVENYGSVEAILKRQDKARGHSSRQTNENTESISGNPAKYAYVKQWHQECFRHQNKNHSTNQEAMREELQTAYSYKASHASERSRPSVADKSHHKSSQRPPKPDHHKASVQLSGKVGHMQSLPEPRSCPNIRAEPKTCDSESSTLTTSQQSEMSDSTTGPKIAVLKQNIIKHQLPFPDKRENAQPKCHREGNFFSPIFEEDSDAVSSVDSDMWWRPSSELNTNNGNVYDQLVEELGSDVDGPARTPVAEQSGDKESGASSSVRENNESGVDATLTKDAVKVDAQIAPSGNTTNAGTTEGDVELHKVDIVDVGGDVEVVPQSETQQAVENVDTKIPVPLDGNAVGAVPLEGSADKPVSLEGNAEKSVPLEGNAEKSVPLDGNAEKPAPSDGNAEKPVPTEGNAETHVNSELATNEAQPDAHIKKEVESDHTGASGQKEEQNLVVVVKDKLQGVTETSGSKHDMLEESMERNDKDVIQQEAGEGFHNEAEGSRQQEDGAGGIGEEETKESIQERQTSPNKPVPDEADHFQLKIKPETRNWSQRRSDQQMCSRLVDISNGHGVVDPWLRKSLSVGLGGWSRLREQESITRDNFDLVKRLLAQETVYSREEQLKDYQKCTRFARHMPEENQKALGIGRQQQITRANWLAKEQARAMDEFCSKGISNNKLKRSLSLPPIRKRSICLDNLKSPYSREVLEKDFLAHCACLKNISKHPGDKVWMTSKEHTMFASRLEETDRRVKLATQKIDKMCRNKEPPYAPRQKSKTWHKSVEWVA